MGATPQTDRWLVCELPATNYIDAWELQRAVVNAKIGGTLAEDVLIVLEHFPVFTLGRRGGMDNLIVSREVLNAHNIPVVHVERGGDITYHGPGQLVAYPIAHLPRMQLSVVAFVERLEAVMRHTAARYGVDARRNPKNRGVWVGPNKLGSIGISVRRGVTFHGLALNATTDLTPFSWIHPCGLEGVKITSLKNESRRRIDMTDVRALIRRGFENAFNVVLKSVRQHELACRIGLPADTSAGANGH
jgi:lipoate-protein ligase B